MTVAKKSKPDGSLTKYYYYDFTINGKRYSRSTKKTTKPEAEQVESDARKEIEERLKIKYTRKSTDIPLSLASKTVMDKFSGKERKQKQTNQKKNIHADFVLFMSETFPKIQFLHEVIPTHIEDYMKYLRAHGPYDPWVRQPGKKPYKRKESKMAPSTMAKYWTELKYLFDHLTFKAGLTFNPVTEVERPSAKNTKREAYTCEELQKIKDNIDSSPNYEHLFYVPLCTGMRLGNACVLTWDDVDMDNHMINAINLKTGGKLLIPILPELYHYLSKCAKQAEELTGYVSPWHAQAYLSGNTQLSKIFVAYLESLGIVTQKKLPGRKAVNIRGIHSLRHTFIYRAVMANIPINIVQAIVGHSDAEMTRMYADHAMAKDMHKVMVDFDVYGDGENSEEQTIINRILKKLYAVNDVEKLLEIERSI